MNHLSILLCTYQGQRYLEAQLESFLSQTRQNFQVHVSDDGSTDGTPHILESYSSKMPLYMYPGPQKGFCENFMSLVLRTEIKSDFYAYSDQDDVWAHEKLEKALEFLKTVPPHRPALYCSRTCYISEKGKTLGLSSPLKRPPSFRHALVQSIAGSNTMVFNHAARDCLLQFGIQKDLVSHDWWTYLVVMGCGGTVFFDPTPQVFYRQHQENLYGENRTLKARLKRLNLLLDGTFKGWIQTHLDLLSSRKDLLTSENQKTLEDVIKWRASNIFTKALMFPRLGLYRNRASDNIALFLCSILGRI